MAESAELKVDKKKTLQKQMSKALIDSKSPKPPPDHESEQCFEDIDCSSSPNEEQTTITWGIRHNHTLELLKLKKQQETVGLALRTKKHEFAEQMEVCSAKRLQLTKRRQEFDEYVASFRPMLEESRVHNFKALQKTKVENLEISKKDKQLVELRKELNGATERIRDTQKSIQCYKPMLVYLDQVKEQMSQGCLDNNIPVCQALVRRYEALQQANSDLKERNHSMMQELTQLQMEQMEQQTKHNSSVMILTSQLAEQKRKLDKLGQGNITREEKLEKITRAQLFKHQTVHAILNAIENISRLCKDSQAPALTTTRGKSILDQRLRHIQEFVFQKNLVVNHALKEISSDRSRVDLLTSLTNSEFHHSVLKQRQDMSRSAP